MKLLHFLIPGFLAAVLLSGCSNGDVPPFSSPTGEEAMGNPTEEMLFSRCGEIVALYGNLVPKNEPQSPRETPVLSQESVDAMENLLLEAGLDVLDTNREYPSYLKSSENFYAFLEKIQHQEAAEQEVIALSDTGALSYRLFSNREGTFKVYSASCTPAGRVSYWDVHEVLDWGLTDRGNFFYRVLPEGDKHYADYTRIHLEAPDLSLYDLTLKYLGPGSYIGSNLFLSDWEEGSWGDLSFNDLWDSLYYDSTGHIFAPETCAYRGEQGCYLLPAEEFEGVVLPYFAIEPDTLRRLAHYDPESDGYPWYPIETNDYVFLSYYTIEPEVTACRENADGTLTLTVEALSTDLKLDCLFAHELTVRPLEDGTFQYVRNRVTYQNKRYGLPFCAPRQTWDSAWS